MQEERIELFYREGSSDKIYKVHLKNENNYWSVDFAYGRRGSTLNTGSKITNTTYVKAKVLYDKLVMEKTCKGYKSNTTTNNDPIVTIDPTKIDSGIRVQLLNPIEESEIEDLINDDFWCAQEKFDGERRVIYYENYNYKAANRKGIRVPVHPRFSAELSGINSSFTIDGEQIGDNFAMFDLLKAYKKNLAKANYRTRYEELKNMVFKKYHSDRSLAGNVFLVYTAFTTQEKRDLFNKLKEEGKEGIVFKKVNGLFKPGRPASGGDHLKFKFYNTCSCIVDKQNEGKRSVSLFMKHNNDNIEVGNVTIPVNKDIPKTNQIVEIKYLYAYKKEIGGTLYQPQFLDVRTDIDFEECSINQLKYKNEDI